MYFSNVTKVVGVSYFFAIENKGFGWKWVLCRQFGPLKGYQIKTKDK